MARCELHGITLDVIRSEPSIWLLTTPLLQKIEDRANGDETVESMVDKILAGHMQLWHIAEGSNCMGAVVTEIIERPDNGKTCHIVACAGVSWSRWGHLIADLEEWAKESGADRIKTWGRKGWAKRLSDYRITRTEYTKEF